MIVYLEVEVYVQIIDMHKFNKNLSSFREEQKDILPEVKKFFHKDIDNALTNTEILETVKNKLKMLKHGKA